MYSHIAAYYTNKVKVARAAGRRPHPEDVKQGMGALLVSVVHSSQYFRVPEGQGFISRDPQ